MEHKLFSLPDVKIAGDGSGFVEGYASTFGNWDDVKERPVPGAFTPFLAEFLKDGFVAAGHDWNALPIATPHEAKEDDHGLFVAAEFHSTPDAQNARTVITERLARGKSVKLSIGYEVLDDEYTQEGRLLKQIKLLEWSYVVWPANRMASVTNAKAGRLLAGLPLTDHSDSVRAAVADLLDRYNGLRDLRAKEGRTFSSANMTRLKDLHESLVQLATDLDALLAAATPEKQKSIHQLRAESLRVRALVHQHGVTL